MPTTTTTSLSFVLKRGQCLHLVDFSVNYCVHVDCGGCVGKDYCCRFLNLAQELCIAPAKASMGHSVTCFDQRKASVPKVTYPGHSHGSYEVWEGEQIHIFRRGSRTYHLKDLLWGFFCFCDTSNRLCSGLRFPSSSITL